MPMPLNINRGVYCKKVKPVPAMMYRLLLVYEKIRIRTNIAGNLWVYIDNYQPQNNLLLLLYAMKFTIEKYHLKSLSFLDLLLPSEKNGIKTEMVRKEFLRGEYIFKEDTFSRGIYIVRKGKIKIFQTGEAGKQSIVYFYRKGDFFGHRPILANETHPVSAVAIDNVVVSFISKELFLKLLQKSDNLARELLNNLSKEFSVWVNKMTVFTQFNLKKRVALTLLILHNVYQRSVSSGKVVISIGREDFASYVGTAKETLVRMLRHFKDDGIIVANGTNITIINMKGLLRLIG